MAASTVMSAGLQMTGAALQSGEVKDQVKSLLGETAADGGVDVDFLLEAGADPVQAMKTNPAFVEQLKKLVVSYVQNTVMSSEIPDVANTKEWGDYSIKVRSRYAAICTSTRAINC